MATDPHEPCEYCRPPHDGYSSKRIKQNLLIGLACVIICVVCIPITLVIDTVRLCIKIGKKIFSLCKN